MLGEFSCRPSPSLKNFASLSAGLKVEGCDKAEKNENAFSLCPVPDLVSLRMACMTSDATDCPVM